MRKPYLIIFAILTAAAITSAGCNNHKVKVLSVNEVLTNPQPYKGSVTIIGVVASISNSNTKEFTLMDIADVRNDKPVRDTFYLSVISSNRAPNVGEAVKVTGQLMEHGLYVAATKVKRWKIRSV